MAKIDTLFHITTQHQINKILSYSDDPNAYIWRVKGDSMFPAIRDGWYVLIEPNAEPVIGEYVLLKLRNGQKLLKELIMVHADGYTVASVNGSKSRTIAKDELEDGNGLQAVKDIMLPSKIKPIPKNPRLASPTAQILINEPQEAHHG